MRRLVTLLAALTLLAGCSGNGSSSTASEEKSGTPSPSSSPSDPPSDDAPPDLTKYFNTPTCGEVRDGIDAFNQGDFAETVRHFEKAVPLAKKADDGSEEAGLLLQAVQYYAELEPSAYPQESARSDEFQRWKTVTLGLCEVPGQEPPQPSESDPGTAT